MVTFGDRLYWLMRARGIDSNAELARQMRVAPNQVQFWLNAINAPTLPTLQKIATALTVPMAVLIEGVRNDKVPRPDDPDLSAILSVGNTEDPVKAAR